MAKITCKKLIIAFLNSNHGYYTPELIQQNIQSKYGCNYSVNNICTRLPELARAGLVEGIFLDGNNFKQWKGINQII